MLKYCDVLMNHDGNLLVGVLMSKIFIAGTVTREFNKDKKNSTTSLELVRFHCLVLKTALLFSVTVFQQYSVSY